MRNKACETIQAYHMILPGDTVIAAVSGGADSTALLFLLHSLCGQLLFTLRACHVDHGLRGAESSDDRLFTEELCRRLGVPLDVKILCDLPKTARAEGKTLEECAREQRYLFFNALALQYGAKIATAHTLSDCAETTLFRMARGTGLRGLLGIPPVRGAIVRPLLFCTRQEVEQYCKEQSLAYCTDSSNASPAYARNRVRQTLVPQMKSIHPGFEAAYAQMLHHLRADEDFLTKEAYKAAQALRCPDGWNAKGLLALHPALCYRVLRLVAEQDGKTLTQRAAQLLTEHLSDENYTLQLERGFFLQLHHGVLRSVRWQEPVSYFEFPAIYGKNCFENGFFAVLTRTNCEHSEQIKKYDRKALKNALDYDRIYGDLVFRQRRAGDSLCTDLRRGTKSLKKLFNEAKLTQRQRQETPVLADAQGVLWVYGFGTALRAAVREDTKTVLTIEVSEEEQT